MPEMGIFVKSIEFSTFSFLSLAFPLLVLGVVRQQRLTPVGKLNT